jgi:hypothetical protein
VYEESVKFVPAVSANANVIVPFPTVALVIETAVGTEIASGLEGALLPDALVATTASPVVARGALGVNDSDVATWFVVVATTVPTAFTTL